VIPITGRSYRLQQSATERAAQKQKPKPGEAPPGPDFGVDIDGCI